MNNQRRERRLRSGMLNRRGVRMLGRDMTKQRKEENHRGLVGIGIMPKNGKEVKKRDRKITTTKRH